MEDEPLHLSRISTEWDLVFQAHNGPPSEITAAQTALLMRYAGAVHRYLLGTLHDPDVAAELDQEFALRFLRGDLHRADPSRGRFRDFVKRAVRNLMIDHYRRQGRRPQSLDANVPEPVAQDDGPADFEQVFLDSWRKELLAQAWKGLAHYQERTGKPYHDVLQVRVRYPDLHSPDLAERLSEKLGKAVSAGWVRQTLHLARDKFSECLLEGVAASLKTPSRAEILEELGDLGLLEHCRPALERLGYLSSRNRPRPKPNPQSDGTTGPTSSKSG